MSLPALSRFRSAPPVLAASSLMLGGLLLGGLAGCRVNVDKTSNGQDKHVRIDTPFGGIHVNTDQTTAADIGLPTYPGATPVNDDGDNQSADVDMGFGQWQLRVKAAHYFSSDSRDKLQSFYRSALKRYGDVLTCQGNQPVGTPTKTADGLTCQSNGNSGSGGQGIASVDTSEHALVLKAGSPHHQHVVTLDEQKSGRTGTNFGLVVLDLPGSNDAD